MYFQTYIQTDKYLEKYVPTQCTPQCAPNSIKFVKYVSHCVWDLQVFPSFTVNMIFIISHLSGF